MRIMRMRSLASRLATASTRVAPRAAAQCHPLLASAHASAVVRSSESLQTLRNGVWTQSVRCFSGAADGSDAIGRQALEKARAFIDADDIDQGMKYLNIAAHEDIADAQYLLASLLEREDGDEDDDNELLLDAEAKRQLAADDDEPQDLKVIRKRARQAYKEYLLSKRAKGEATAGAGSRLATRLVQRATKSDLDRAFGVTLTQLLDPKTKLRPLSSVAQEEREHAQLSGDSTQAVEWMRRAAANGHRDAHVYLGNICLEQDPPLPRHALEWYFRVSPPKVEKNPHPDALFNIGMILYDGVDEAEPPFPANRAASIPYFVRAAEEGDASAQFFMGQLLHTGDEELGIEPNGQSAIMLIEKAAENDHTGAQYYLAMMYRSGDEECGIKPNREKFLEYLDMALEGGDEDALFCMADMYFHGSDGFEKDVKQAKMFYEAAGDAGNADAYCCLGALYYNGTGVKQDFEKAFVYYQAAADRHSMEAWKNLADMYYLGRGVPKSEATAESILKMLQKMEAEENDDEDEL